MCIERVSSVAMKYHRQFTDQGSSSQVGAATVSNDVIALNKFIANEKIKHLCRLRSENGGEYIWDAFEEVLIEKFFTNYQLCTHRTKTEQSSETGALNWRWHRQF